MSDPRVEELEMKVAFLERHLEGIDKAFLEVHDQLRSLTETVERLSAQQQRNSGPGGEEGAADAIPPHY